MVLAAARQLDAGSASALRLLEERRLDHLGDLLRLRGRQAGVHVHLRRVIRLALGPVPGATLMVPLVLHDAPVEEHPARVEHGQADRCPFGGLLAFWHPHLANLRDHGGTALALVLATRRAKADVVNYAANRGLHAASSRPMSTSLLPLSGRSRSRHIFRKVCGCSRPRSTATGPSPAGS